MAEAYNYSLMKNISLLLRHPRSSLRMLQNMSWRANRFTLMEETFLSQAYYWLASRLRPGTTILDIGANIGDTAIYFSQFPNVKRVISFEPMPSTYKTALEYVRESPFAGKVTLYNRAIEDAASTKRLSAARVINNHREFKLQNEVSDGVTVQAITLSQALKSLKNVAIKCDCEGAEATMFDSADLANVYAIQIEYHDCLAEVKKALKSKGFNVTHSGNGKIGMVYAVRNAVHKD